MHKAIWYIYKCLHRRPCQISNTFSYFFISYVLNSLELSSDMRNQDRLAYVLLTFLQLTLYTIENGWFLAWLTKTWSERRNGTLYSTKSSTGGKPYVEVTIYLPLFTLKYKLMIFFRLSMQSLTHMYSFCIFLFKLTFLYHCQNGRTIKQEFDVLITDMACTPRSKIPVVIVLHSIYIEQS